MKVLTWLSAEVGQEGLAHDEEGAALGADQSLEVPHTLLAERLAADELQNQGRGWRRGGGQ